ncbi:MAG: hypothetical protein M3P96_00215 [Actinomycetota bacterium]|nr:hypothetical protein [Actinomycetota bacterium]
MAMAVIFWLFPFSSPSLLETLIVVGGVPAVYTTSGSAPSGLEGVAMS